MAIGVRCLAPQLLVVLALWAWAQAATPQPSGTLSVALVQGGIPTWVYKNAEDQDAWRLVPQDIYETLTRQVKGADLTIWPETAVWRLWGEDRAYETFLKRLSSNHQGALLIGAPRRDAGASYMNSAVLLESGELLGIANKRRLALIAEASFSPDPHVQILRWRSHDFGVIFCLESLVSEYAAQTVREGASFLAVLAEGGRFGQTPVAWVHATRSIVRAVETGRSVLHTGQHGHTMLIDAAGNFTLPLDVYRAAVLRGSMKLYDAEQTPYVRFGDWVVWASLMMLFGGGVWQVYRRLC
ncbi:MAG: nitrilase-related carbon-nitrogen hydrolase [Myxococcota bacterium]